MTITEGEVRRIARLSRLSLTEEEVRLYQEQLGRILGHMEELRGVDTSSVEPAASAHGPANVLRPDEPRSWDAAQSLLENAPALDGRYIRVPKVIE